MQQARAPLLAALQHNIMLEQAMPLVLLELEDMTVSEPYETMVWVPSGQPPHPAVDWARTEVPRCTSAAQQTPRKQGGDDTQHTRVSEPNRRLHGTPDVVKLQALT